jgi:hypothetical protein
MWFLVSVVKGSRYFDATSRIDNRVLISDSTDMVILGRLVGGEGYRFEARKGNDTFTLTDFEPGQSAGTLTARFTALAKQMGAVIAAG